MDTGRPVVRARPQRTCVGCRARTAKAELLRLVVVDGSVTPDPTGRSPGRGAHLHPDLGCFDLALRRRAFPRAFRLPGPLDGDPVRGYLEARARTDSTTRTAPSSTVPEAGRDDDDRTMSTHR